MQLHDPATDPQALDAAALATRKRRLLDPETGSLAAYEAAIVATKARVKEEEGEDMREAIQDKVGCQLCARVCAVHVGRLGWSLG